jgi:hypothetical protein
MLSFQLCTVPGSVNFGGFELMHLGLVFASGWRPDPRQGS